jgi:hypothetical protein
MWIPAVYFSDCLRIIGKILFKENLKIFLELDKASVGESLALLFDKILYYTGIYARSKFIIIGYVEVYRQKTL